MRVANEIYFADHTFFCGQCAVIGDEKVPNIEETDVPTHCEGCEALLPFDLTPHGYDYVEDHILMYIESGGEMGRQEVIKLWADYYSEAVTTGVVDQIREDMHRSEIVELINGALEV